MSTQALSPTEYWLSEDDLASIYTADYWNDIEAEKGKEWWIADGKYEALWQHLKSTRMLDDYLAAEDELNAILMGRNAAIVDLAAGICWTSALLSKMDCITDVHCVEISKHRIDLLGPSAVDMFGGVAKKIRRYVGSFYETRFADNSVDVVFISQAFHHADRPFALLNEIYRILKKDGTALLVGEHYVGFAWIVRRFISVLIKQRKISLNFRELFRPEPVWGDHYYTLSDYFFIAEAVGFACEVKRSPSGGAMFILRKK